MTSQNPSTLHTLSYLVPIHKWVWRTIWSHAKQSTVKASIHPTLAEAGGQWKPGWPTRKIGENRSLSQDVTSTPELCSKFLLISWARIQSLHRSLRSLTLSKVLLTTQQFQRTSLRISYGKLSRQTKEWSLVKNTCWEDAFFYYMQWHNGIIIDIQ